MSSGYCWRVANRIACVACEYPPSEALYQNLMQWRLVHEEDLVADPQLRENYNQAAFGASLFGEKV